MALDRLPVVCLLLAHAATPSLVCKAGTEQTVLGALGSGEFQGLSESPSQGDFSAGWELISRETREGPGRAAQDLTFPGAGKMSFDGCVINADI